MNREALLGRLRAQRPLFETDAASLRALHPLSRRGGAEMERLAGDLRAYCMFIGYPRSGHSLVGSLLDAHDAVAIAHELDALAFIDAGFDWRQVYWLILQNARLFTELGRVWGEFRYAVPGRPHGRWSVLRVIGDKKGGGSTLRISENFALLDRVRAVMPVPVKFIHVVRNPFDTIATMAAIAGTPPAQKVGDYFFYHEANRRIVASLPEGRVLHLYHEDLVAAPRERLAELCRFLEIEAPADYLEDCAKLVYDRPRRSRDRVAWDAETLRAIAGRCAASPWLARYDYHG